MAIKKMETGTTEQFIENASVNWKRMAKGVRRKIMTYDDRLMLVRVEFESGGVGDVHSHAEVQVTNVESGVFEIEINKHKKVLKAGDAFYVPSNARHGVVCIEAGVLVDVFSPFRKDFLDEK
jgi:quercetin dioxygenase-like cupin family protein